MSIISTGLPKARTSNPALRSAFVDALTSGSKSPPCIGPTHVVAELPNFLIVSLAPSRLTFIVSLAYSSESE